MHTAHRLILITLLILAAVLFSGVVNAEHLDLSWTHATTRADGTAFDPETELASIEIGCGESLTGPFDSFTASVPKEDSKPAPTRYATEQAPDNLQGCVAFSVDLGGLVSAPSNVAKLEYKSPISALQDLQTHCYGSCPGAVNFNITIRTAP